MVTANARDYITLAAKSEIHAGLIILRAHDLTAEEQWQHLEPVIDRRLAEGLDLTNHVVEVWDIGGFEIRPIPPP